MSPQKKVLLINPWIYDFTAYDFWMKPLGLLYLAALLKEYTDFELSYIDCLDRYHPLLDKKLKTKPDGRGPFFKEEVSKPRILNKVPRKYSRYGIPLSLFSHELKQVHRPDLVLLTCPMTYWYPGVQTVVGMVREKFGRVPILLGGIYPTLLPQHALSQTGVDAICRGPGERQIFALINDILGDGTCPQQSIETLEELPIPDFGLLRDRTSLPLLTSRGCLMNCTFCASSLLFSGLEQRSASSVVTELDILSKLYRPKHIAFYDDALLLNSQEHIVPILKGIIQKKLPLMFHTPNGLHVNEIDSELASLFRKAGFHSLYLSQETFDETVVKESCPKVSTGDLGRALDLLQRAGFNRAEINVYLMVGLPDQDLSGIKDAILRVRSLGAQARLAYFSPIPGTLEWGRMVAKGYLDEQADPLLQNKLVFPYVCGNVSPEEFESLKEFLDS